MASLNNEEVRIQVLINKDTEQGRFQDAVYFSKAEFEALSDSELENIKNQRANNWVNSVKAASKVERVVSKEDLEAEKASLLEALSEVDAEIAEVSKTK
jgi:hypothetical protein